MQLKAEKAHYIQKICSGVTHLKEGFVCSENFSSLTPSWRGLKFPHYEANL